MLENKKSELIIRSDDEKKSSISINQGTSSAINLLKTLFITFTGGGIRIIIHILMAEHGEVMKAVISTKRCMIGHSKLNIVVTTVYEPVVTVSPAQVLTQRILR